MNVAFRQDVASARESVVAPLNPAIDSARVEIFDSLQAAEPAWRRLEATAALTTPYQRFEWIALWQRNIGKSEGIEPLIVVATDSFGSPLFLLPLARRRKGALSIAGFFGGRHANLNSGLWRRDVAAAMTADNLRAILARVAASCGVDLIKLVSQPERVDGFANPFALLPHQRTPDDVYAATLHGRTGEQALRSCLKSSMRGRLRTKERKLQEMAGYRYAVAATPAEVDRFLDAFLAQKAAHLAEQGVPNIFEDRKVVAFLRAACHHGLADRKPVIELHALECDTEVIAIFGGVNNGRRLSCMINSYTPGEASRWSPGLVLMTHLITRCGDTGVTSLDLGAGHATYKTFFCKETEHTFDTIIGFTPAGRATAHLIAGSRHLKGWLKSTPALWAVTKIVRKLFNQ
jgi:CelD/BcsL family acetyltransferase involved in cellulose biosynthesis